MTKPSLREGVYRLFRYNVLSFAIRLVTSALIARAMGPTAMGVWLLLSLLPTYAEGFVRLKADVAAVYVLPRGEWDLGEVSLAVAIIALLSSVPVTALLLVLESQIVSWLFGSAGVESAWYRLVILSIPVHFLALGYSYLLLHLEDVTSYNVQSFLRTVLPSVAVTVVVLTTPLRLGALASSILAGAAIGLIYGALVVHRRAPLRFARKPGLYRALLSFGRRLYVAGAVEHLNQYLSSLLVGVYMRPADVTFLRLGQDRLQVLDQVPTAVNTLLFPRIAKETDPTAQVDLLAQSTRILTLLLALAGTVGAILTPGIVWVLYGNEFMPMVWSIWLLLPGVVLLGATSPATQYFMGSGRPDLVWKLGLVPLLLQIALLTWVIAAWGFRGAALAVSISFIAHAVARLLLLRKITGRALRSFAAPGRTDAALLWGFLLARIKPRLRAGTA